MNIQCGVYCLRPPLNRRFYCRTDLLHDYERAAPRTSPAEAHLAACRYSENRGAIVAHLSCDDS